MSCTLHPVLLTHLNPLLHLLAGRWMVDSRDEAKEWRLADVNDQTKLWR